MSSATTVAHPFNPSKILWHSAEIKKMLRGEATNAPVSLEWDLSNTCNHGCAFCSFGTEESQGYRFQNWQHFPSDRAFSIIPELAAAGVQSITFTGGGEPLMHKDAPKIMQAVHDAGMSFGLVTNGALMGEKVRGILAKHAVFVRVSLDSGTPETHQLMHRTKALQFDDILKNMAALVAAADESPRTVPLAVGASFCVTDANWREIIKCAARLKVIGATYLEVRPTYPTTWRGDGWDFALSNIPDAVRALNDARVACDDADFKIIGMIDRFDALETNGKPYDKCRIGPLTSILGAEGSLWHCCVQRGQEAFKLANVLHQSFADAWKEAQARRMEQIIDVGKCPKCRYDNSNIALMGVATGAMHLDFV